MSKYDYLDNLQRILYYFIGIAQRLYDNGPFGLRHSLVPICK